MNNNNINEQRDYSKLIDRLTNLIKDSYRKGDPINVVFIVGAGASKVAGVPLSSELKSHLCVGCEDVMNDMLLEREFKHSIGEATFEMVMSLYNELNDEMAGYNFLKNHIPDIEEAYTMAIPFSYEVIAHMFNFRLTQYIISLNFDELLERALDDEVGFNGYRKVHSPSGFDRLIVMEELNNPFQRFLLKPHGTISFKRTLRHTWKEVTKLDVEKHKVLSKILSNADVIITVGYGFKDRDIRPLILSQVTRKDSQAPKTLYIITKKLFNSGKNRDEVEELIERIGKEANANIIDCGSEQFFKDFSEKLFKDEFERWFPGIEKHRARYLITKKIKSEGRLTTISNNEIDSIIRNKSNIIINQVLKNNNLNTKDNAKNLITLSHIYMKLLVEIMLFIASIRGKFRSSVLLESARIKRYLWSIQRYITNLTPDIIQGAVYEKFTINAALNEFQELFIKNESKGKSNETYDKDFLERINICAIELEKDKTYEEYLAEKLLNCLRISNSEEYDEIKKLVIKITGKLDIAIVRDTNNLVHFKRPLIICNYKEFDEHTDYILRQSSKIRIIAETGEWIWKKLNNNKTYNFNELDILISNFKEEHYDKHNFHYARSLEVYDCLQTIQKKVEQYREIINISLYIDDMPHHMTIGDNEAIYFYRSGRSISVCPILLRNRTDIDKLISYFENQWSKYFTAT